jgi:protease I
MSAGQRAAVLAEHGYHELDFWYPVLRLREAGAEVSVIGPSRDETYRSPLGYPVIPDNDFAAAAQADYDVLIVPGGAAAARLAENAEARRLVQAHLGRGRTVALLGADDSHSLLAGEADAAAARGTILRYASTDDLPALAPALLGDESTPMRGTRVLVLAESQYQELELWYPVLRFREAGADVAVGAPEAGALYSSKLGYPVRSDVSVADVDPADVGVLVIPGGFAPEAMRRSAALLDLVRKCHANGQLVAAICHAGWVLASAGIAKGRQLTCVPVIRDDVISAGANYVDQPVVRDGNLITSRLPNDLDVFCAEIIRAAAEHAGPRGDGHSWPSGERRSHAAFTVPAVLRQAPGGRATANYRTVSAAAG